MKTEKDRKCFGVKTISEREVSKKEH